MDFLKNKQKSKWVRIYSYASIIIQLYFMYTLSVLQVCFKYDTTMVEIFFKNVSSRVQTEIT